MRKIFLTVIATIAALCLVPIPSGHAQGGNIGSTSSPVANNMGRPIPGANIAICQPLATTAASVTSNVAVLTMASNPQTAGFAAGMQIQVAGFTGADTIFNGGSLVNGQITSGFTILSVTSTTITFSLTHANATATTNGTVLQEGNSTTSCGGLSAIYSDPGLTQAITQPLQSDALGNWNAFGAPGLYYAQFYGPVLTTVIKQIAIACVPLNSANCGALLGSPNTWTGAQTFTSTLSTANISPTAAGAFTVGSVGVPYLNLVLGSATNQSTTQASAATANRTVTWPDAGGIPILDAATQTLTNKTLNVPLTSGTGLQIFSATTTCTTAASAGATCTTAAISLPAAEADTSYRLACTGKGPTNVPVVIATTNSSATQFTITIAALTAAAATFSSYDCVAGHN